MNEIVNKFLVAGDKVMPEMHLKQPRFTYSVCGPSQKTKNELRNLCNQEMQILFTKMSLIKLIKLDQTCFQHDMAYGNSKDIAKRTQSDKALRDKASKIASDPEYDGYQRGLASVVYKFFSNFSLANKSATEPNDQLANERHKIIKKFKRTNVYSSYRDLIVDLADM